MMVKNHFMMMVSDGQEEGPNRPFVVELEDGAKHELCMEPGRHIVIMPVTGETKSHLRQYRKREISMIGLIQNRCSVGSELRAQARRRPRRRHAAELAAAL